MKRTTGVEATALSIAARVSAERKRGWGKAVRVARGRVWRKAWDSVSLVYEMMGWRCGDARVVHLTYRC